MSLLHLSPGLRIISLGLRPWVFRDEKAIGDTFEALQRTGLPDCAYHSCQIFIFSFHIIEKKKTFNLMNNQVESTQQTLSQHYFKPKFMHVGPNLNSLKSLIFDMLNSLCAYISKPGGQSLRCAFFKDFIVLRA